MTDLVGAACDGVATNDPGAQISRPRPRIHFTAESGWINDPHGIRYADGQYHLFYQFNPAGTIWSHVCHWGHAVSRDLMHWTRLPTALSPRQDEGGCWSGATLFQNGRLTIAYTSVPPDDWGRGRVALAHADSRGVHWTSTPEDIVIDGPPAELGAYAFRDPCIFASEGGWTMIVGAGLEGGVGAALQYSSPNARDWHYDGVLCSRPGSESGDTWTGALWECPQLIRLGDDWALLISVWEDDTLHYVAGAVGTYDGKRFTPERWTRLTHDDTAYALTSFTDFSGRRCVMAWLREDPQHDPSSSPWAGALSLPMVIEVANDRILRLRPHPDVDGLRMFSGLTSGPLTPGRDIVIPDATTGIDVSVTTDRTQPVTLTLTDPAGLLLTVTVDPTIPGVVVSRPGRDPVTVPIAGDQVRVLLDADLVEIFGGQGSGAFRVPVRITADLHISGTASDITVHRLAPAMEGGR
ncbi:MAG TPA: glycoside hydrolase family 32 protein [Microlunatus sp.]|nr:glycoside hydrolase family 32 protein [Microlunatus sp.]